MGLKSEESGMSWQCNGHLSYILPCKGCAKCIKAAENDKSAHRWWHVFVSRQTTGPGNTDVISLSFGISMRAIKPFSFSVFP
jgi:hypothetical protein